MLRLSSFLPPRSARRAGTNGFYHDMYAAGFRREGPDDKLRTGLGTHRIVPCEELGYWRPCKGAAQGYGIAARRRSVCSQLVGLRGDMCAYVFVGRTIRFACEVRMRTVVHIVFGVVGSDKLLWSVCSATSIPEVIGEEWL